MSHPVIQALRTCWRAISTVLFVAAVVWGGLSLMVLAGVLWQMA